MPPQKHLCKQSVACCHRLMRTPIFKLILYDEKHNKSVEKKSYCWTLKHLTKNGHFWWRNITSGEKKDCKRQNGPKVLSALTLSTPLGKGGATISDEFTEKFQTAFDPPPHFWKIILQFFYDIYGCICQGCRRFLTISDPRWDQPISDIFI